MTSDDGDVTVLSLRGHRPVLPRDWVAGPRRGRALAPTRRVRGAFFLQSHFLNTQVFRDPLGVNGEVLLARRPRHGKERAVKLDVLPVVVFVLTRPDAIDGAGCGRSARLRRWAVGRPRCPRRLRSLSWAARHPSHPVPGAAKHNQRNGNQLWFWKENAIIILWMNAANH
jgi:hypothetical protein